MIEHLSYTTFTTANLKHCKSRQTNVKLYVYSVALLTPRSSKPPNL